MTQQPLPNIPLFKPKTDNGIPPLSTELALIVEITFLAVAILFFLMGKSLFWKDLIDNISINFLAIIVEALPFMLIGSLAGGLIEMFVSVSWIEKVFRQRKNKSRFSGWHYGAVFPSL